jgi:hypothetical protein
MGTRRSVFDPIPPSRYTFTGGFAMKKPDYYPYSVEGVSHAEANGFYPD